MNFQISIVIVLAFSIISCAHQGKNIARVQETQNSISESSGVVVIGFTTSTGEISSGFTVRYAPREGGSYSRDIGIDGSSGDDIIKVFEQNAGDYYLSFGRLVCGDSNFVTAQHSGMFATFRVVAGEITYLGDIKLTEATLRKQVGDEAKDVHGSIDFSIQNNWENRLRQIENNYVLSRKLNIKEGLMTLDEDKVNSGSIIFVTDSEYSDSIARQPHSINDSSGELIITVIAAISGGM